MRIAGFCFAIILAFIFSFTAFADVSNIDAKYFDTKNGLRFLFIENHDLPVIVMDITFKKALTIGFWQCLAMMPGTSRSAASIIGGMQQNLTRKAAAEFSFFLAVPTMLAVTFYSIFVKDWNHNGLEQKGYEIDRRRISIIDEVKEAGTYKAQIDFGKENLVDLEFEVVGE